MPAPTDRPSPSTGFLVWHLNLRWRAAIDRALAPLGLTSSQYGVLASLYAFSAGGARPRQRELADFTGLEPMHVSKLTRALERAGLVERTDHPDDTRAVALAVTERGAEVVAAARARVLDVEEQRLAPLGGRHSEESAALAGMLLTLLRHAETLGGEGAGDEPERPTPQAPSAPDREVP